MDDKWIVGEGDQTGRVYVVHTSRPRFALQVVTIHGHFDPNLAPIWFDEPSPGDEDRLRGEALAAYQAIREPC